MPLLEPSPGSHLSPDSAAFSRRLWRHGKIVGRFALVQALVQLLGFLSGILIVRYLARQEYACFTIANTMQGTLNMLADIGISVALISIGGRVWQDRPRLSRMITTALYLRRRLALLAAAVVSPILYYMLTRNGATSFYAVILIVIVLIGLASQLNLGVLSVVPRLYSKINFIQRLDLTAAFTRLVVLGLLTFVYFNAGAAVAVASGAFLLQSFLLRRYVREVVDLKAPLEPDDRRVMVGLVKGQAANVIFFSLQGQITVFLAGFLGQRGSSVAEVGALGRLAMIFTILTNLLANVLIPTFARCQDRRRSARLYLEIVAAVVGFCGLVLAGCSLFPSPILAILGPQYANLRVELFWMAGIAIVSALTGTFFGLNSARSWLVGSWLNVPLTVATQVLLIPWTDFGNVRSLLIFSFFSSLPNLFLHLVFSVRGYGGWRELPPA